MVILVLGHGVVHLDEDILQGLVPLEVEFHELRVERRTHHIAPCTNKERQQTEHKAGQI